MKAEEMFINLGYNYERIDNSNMNCEDIILCKHKTNDMQIQFNLFCKIVVFQMENKYVGYDKIVMFMTKELIRAINKQAEELGWYSENE